MQDSDSVVRPESPAPPLRIVAFSMMALFLGVAVVWVFARSAQETFSGHIVSRTTFVTADRAGVVTELIARESDRVTLGDPLLILADEALQDQIDAAHEHVATLTAALSQAEAAANVELAWRMKEIDEDITATQLQAAGFLKEKFNYEMERSMWADVLASHETVMRFDEVRPRRLQLRAYRYLLGRAKPKKSIGGASSKRSTGWTAGSQIWFWMTAVT